MVVVTAVNVAVTDCAAVIETEQMLEVPLHAPPHPVKVEPLAAMARTLTVVPEVKLAVQVAPQLMPVGELVTVPLPVPDFVTLKA